jgi:hypothetical protein
VPNARRGSRAPLSVGQRGAVFARPEVENVQPAEEMDLVLCASGRLSDLKAAHEGGAGRLVISPREHEALAQPSLQLHLAVGAAPSLAERDDGPLGPLLAFADERQAHEERGRSDGQCRPSLDVTALTEAPCKRRTYVVYMIPIPSQDLCPGQFEGCRVQIGQAVALVDSVPRGDLGVLPARGAPRVSVGARRVE